MTREEKINQMLEMTVEIYELSYRNMNDKELDREYKKLTENLKFIHMVYKRVDELEEGETNEEFGCE